MKGRNQVFITSLILTIGVFLIGIFLSYALDYLRVNEVNDVISEYELGKEAYLLEQNFFDSLGGDTCSIMQRRISQLKAEIQDVGMELAKYSSKTLFKGFDFDLMKHKYALLQLRFLATIEDTNRLCGKQYIPIIHFFDDKDTLTSERQAYILTEINEEFPKEVVTISLDFNYDKEPLIKAMALKYNVTKVPTIIIDSQKYERVLYTGEIRTIVKDILATINTDPYYESSDLAAFDLQSVEESDTLAALYRSLNTASDPLAKGDLLISIGRLIGNSSLVCGSLPYFESVLNSSDKEAKALAYETIASIGCGFDSSSNLFKAADIWDEIGVHFRAQIYRDIANGNSPKLNFAPADPVQGNMSLSDDSKYLMIGESKIVISKDDVIVSQVDRVLRDWLGGQMDSSPFEGPILDVFSERFTYPEKDLRSDIGWHEGGRIKQILAYSGASLVPSSGTLVRKIHDNWYAPNEEGVFMFEVPPDKVHYPTTRFLRNDFAVIVDTHGINMLVEQAVRKNASVVIGCCDHPGKIAAAQYLSSKGIRTICFTDKYLPLALFSGSSVLGSPPVKHVQDFAVVGDQPVSVNLSEVIIVEDAAEGAPSYYDTPKRYFDTFNDYMHLRTVVVPAGKDEAYKLVEAAELFNSSVIAARIFTRDEYISYSRWLSSSPDNRIILFHSASYPYGYLLLKEFPDQASFDDIDPVFVSSAEVST